MGKSNTRLIYYSLFFILISFLAQGTVKGSDRIWSNRGTDNGTVHSLGNGKMLVYQTGPQISTIYPGPYSSPSLYKLLLEDEQEVKVYSDRKESTAIWTHSLRIENQDVGSMSDFVDAKLPCMVRRMELDRPLRFRLELHPGMQFQLQQNKGEGSLLIRSDPGELIYQYYVYPKPLYHQLYWHGELSLVKSKEENNVYYFEAGAGVSELYLIGGPEYDELENHMEEIKRLSYSGLFERTVIWWNKFSSRRKDFNTLLPANLPQREKLIRTIDEVSVMIRTQQAEEGAVMAGYPYPLGYVRDQYGVSRAYLALGYYQEAKNILKFYWNIWEKAGELHCAQGIGVNGIFHIHENDEVESPGYLIMQAFDLLEKTGDQAFLHSIFPMLEWCWEVQKKHLAGNMLPFNGDETYVAGGILPRSALNDGSSEATMLFIDGGELLLNWIKKEKLWKASRLQAERNLLEEVRSSFKDNFWKDEGLITNNPARTEGLELPLFRHGVCERGGAKCLVYRTSGFGGIEWTQRDEHGRYQCMNCLVEGPLPIAERIVYRLVSVSLTPLYFHSGLFETPELKPVVEGIYSSFQISGVLTSRTTTSVSEVSQRSVGYDYGLVLYAMIRTGAEGQQEIYEKTLEIVDDIGAWSEYYLGETPSGTRCRPWESAINLEALLEFASQYQAITP